MLFLTVARRLWATSLLYGVVVNAQSNVEILVFGANALPSCANGCQMLLNAQSGCVPPAAPVTSPQIYKSCFCQSALLITLRTTPVGVCDTVCTDPTALTQIMTWYNSYCASGDLPSVSSSVSTPSATTSSTTSTSTSAVASKSSGNQPTQSWCGLTIDLCLSLRMLTRLQDGRTLEIRSRYNCFGCNDNWRGNRGSIVQTP